MLEKNKKGKKDFMDLKRIITALIGLPSMVLAIILGNKYIIGIGIVIVGIICMYEYFGVIKKVSKPIEWVGYLSTILIVSAIFIEASKMITLVTYSIPFFMLLLFLQVIITNMRTNFKDVAYTFIGIIYISFFLMFIVLIRGLEHGKILMGYTLIISWATDIFAYLIGRKFGKHKFSKISPKKSIEGSIAGIIGSIVISVIYTFIISKYWQIHNQYTLVIFATFILSIISQIGDFVASSIKRFVDVKDYSELLPGHGGMLDRIDSLLFILPFSYIICLFI